MSEPEANFHASAFSTSFERLDDGGSRLVVATLENGEVFAMTLGEQETIDNITAWATAMGLIVARPL